MFFENKIVILLKKLETKLSETLEIWGENNLYKGERIGKHAES